MVRAKLRRRLWLLAALALLLGPLALFNLTVGFFGNSWVFPLSPFHLRNKARALGLYFQHRAACVWRGHEPLPAIIARAESRHRLPRGLMGAVVQVESEGRPHRISHCGAMGPAQLMPATARELRVSDPFDPAQAIDGGARYLAAQLARFRDVRRAVAAYNAGPGAVRGGIPRNGETEYYVAKVMRAWKRPVARRWRPAIGPVHR